MACWKSCYPEHQRLSRGRSRSTKTEWIQAARLHQAAGLLALRMVLMQRATTDVLYFETGPHNAVTMSVHPGEAFEVQTQLNRGPWFEGHPRGEELRQKLRGGNPSSGCIEVRGATVG